MAEAVQRPYTLPNLPFAAAINKVIYSNLFPFLVALVTLAAHVLALDLYAYMLVGALMLYVAVFGKDYSPVLALAIFCYILPSRLNNPGMYEGSVFFMKNGGLAIVIAGFIVLAAAIVRFSLDGEIGFRRMFRTKRALLWGMLALGAAYLLAGVGSKGYAALAGKNLGFGLIQFVAVFFCYFVLGFAVKWKEIDKRYFAYVGLLVGLTVGLELLNLYRTGVVFDSGELVRDFMYVGWGINNNMGVLIVMAVPFAFYFVFLGEHPVVYNILAVALCGLAVLSASRGAILGAAFIYIVCVAIVVWKGKSKFASRFSLACLLALLVAGIAVGFISDTLQEVTFRFGFTSDSRIKLYECGLRVFGEAPIFGDGFFRLNEYFWDYAIWNKVDAFADSFPERWHNTWVQMLACCGVVGLVAYAWHRYQTLELVLKKPNVEKTFIALSMAMLLLLSLIDCHFFIVGPTLFYSCALAFAEYKDPTQ